MISSGQKKIKSLPTRNILARSRLEVTLKDRAGGRETIFCLGKYDVQFIRNGPKSAFSKKNNQTVVL